MRRAAAAGFAAVLAWAAPAAAVQPDEVLRDPTLEARARDISAGLRCLVCQNQSIDDSDAPLARDLRLLVRDRLTRGEDDGAVQSFIVARYGEFVLLRPPLSWQTLLLWGGPGVILVLGAGGLLAAFRSRRGGAPAPLSDDERRDLAQVLAEPDSSAP